VILEKRTKRKPKSC